MYIFQKLKCHKLFVQILIWHFYNIPRYSFKSSAANAYLERAKQDGTMDDIATVALAKAAQQVCGK